MTAAAYRDVLTADHGIDLRDGGQATIADGNADSPLAQIRAILAAGYAQTTPFSTGTIRGTALAAGRVIGYGETNGNTVIARATLAGDADLDVDFNDFVLLQSNFGKDSAAFAQGDFDYDGVVTFDDFVLTQSDFGVRLGGGSTVLREQYAADEHHRCQPGAGAGEPRHTRHRCGGFDASATNMLARPKPA